MKSLLKFAMGAAVAGTLVNMLMKQRAQKGSASRGETLADAGPDSSYDEQSDLGAAQAGDEVIADTNSVGQTQDQNGEQPQDWRGAQNVLGT